MADGCSAVCDFKGDHSFEGAEMSYRYESNGLIVIYGDLSIRIPVAFFDPILDSGIEIEEEGWVSKLYVYGKVDNYSTFFSGALYLRVEEVLKAKGVAEYLAQQSTAA